MKKIIGIVIVFMFVAIHSTDAFSPNTKNIRYARMDSDGDLEIVLMSGYVLEVDKSSLTVELETMQSKDIGGGKIAVIVAENGMYNVYLRGTQILFLSNVMFLNDSDGDKKVVLSNGRNTLYLEIDKGEVFGERRGSMELESKSKGVSNTIEIKRKHFRQIVKAFPRPRN